MAAERKLSGGLHYRDESAFVLNPSSGEPLNMPDDHATSPIPTVWVRVDTLNDAAELALSSSIQCAMDQALQAVRQAHAAEYLPGVARGNMLLGYCHMLLGKYDQAITLLEESAAQALSLQLTPIRSRSLNGLAVTYARMGQYGQALERHFESLKLVQASQDEVGQARSLNNIGNLYMDLKEHVQALKYHLDALELAERAQVQTLVSTVSLNAAIDYHDLGQYTQALALNEQTLARVRAEGFRHHECLLLANMAANLLYLGHLDAAWSASEDSIRLSAELGEQENLCEALATRGRVLMRLGQLTAAEASLEQSLEIARTIKNKKRESEAHAALSEVFEAQGAFEPALQHARQHERIVGDLNADVLRHKTQLLSTQLQVERAEHRVVQEQLRNTQLAEANAALHQVQERLAYQAQHDALTGLHNRAAFEAALQLAVMDEQQSTMGVLFIDLDHFKQVNDTLGHSVGDALLMQVAQRLTGCVREGDLVARQGGDEFTVLLRRVGSHSEAETVAQRILDALSLPVHLADRQLVVTASIGLALFPHDGTDVTTLQKNADLAMYLAKRERHSVQRFQPSLSDAAIDLWNLQQDLRGALQRDELRLHYQPIVTAQALMPVAVEALVRWQHPTLGLLPPARFVPLAEDSDLIVPLGAWVLQEACRQLQEWRQLQPELRVTVNVAPRQFTHPEFAAFIPRTLQKYMLPADALELEVTESAVLEPQSMLPYEALLSAGLRLSIDDFGTGYSSIVRLFEVPAQVLKIDRSLIAKLVMRDASDRSTAPLVRALLTFARESGLQVVAEGVETSAQLDALQQLDCDLVQGYFVARPMPPDEMRAWLMERAATSPTRIRRDSRLRPPCQT